MPIRPKISCFAVLLTSLILLAGCYQAETALPITMISPPAETLAVQGTQTPAPTTEKKAVPFDLGDSMIAQPWASLEEFRNMPVQLNGLIAVPPTGDNLPIAVILHGSHDIGCPSLDGYTATWPCPGEEIPNYQGFAYLIEALAEHGYVAVSLNANPAYVSAYGQPAANQRLPLLLDQYLAKIAAATKGEDVGQGVDLTGRVDWKQLVILGHSAGGEAVSWIIESRDDQIAPEQINAGQGPIAAAILLAPSATNPRDIVASLPLAVILPACDQDVADLSGQFYYEFARQKPQSDDLAVSVYLPGMNHNRFNTLLGDETLGNASSICDGALLPEEAQQGFLVDYAIHFFDAVLGRDGGNAALGGIDASQPAPVELFERQVLTSLALPTAQRLALPLSANGAKGVVTGLDCESGYSLDEEKMETCRLRFNQPGSPGELALAWNGAGGVYSLDLTDGKRDLTEYQMLHLRAVVDPLNPLNKQGQPQSFSLRLTDGDGKSASVILKDEPALAFPAGKKGFDDSLNVDTWDNHVILSSIRVPLTMFSGVDLSNISAISLVFDAADSGAIFVTDLELLRP